MDKLNALFRHSEEEMFGMYVHFSDKGHMINLENEDVGEEHNLQDIELAYINVVILEKNKWL